MDSRDLEALRADAAKPERDRTRYDTARRLAEMPDSLPGTISLLADAAPGVRELAAWMIACRGQSGQALAAEAALPGIVRLVAEDPAPRVRQSGMRALQFFATAPELGERVRPALEQAAAGDDPELACSAAFGLHRLDPAHPLIAPAFARALERPEPPGSNQHQEVCLLLAELGPAAAPAGPAVARLALATRDDDLLASAIAALAACGGHDARQALVVLSDRTDAIGDQAMQVLSDMYA